MARGEAPEFPQLIAQKDEPADGRRPNLLFIASALIAASATFVLLLGFIRLRSTIADRNKIAVRSIRRSRDCGPELSMSR